MAPKKIPFSGDTITVEAPPPAAAAAAVDTELIEARCDDDANDSYCYSIVMVMGMVIVRYHRHQLRSSSLSPSSLSSCFLSSSTLPWTVAILAQGHIRRLGRRWVLFWWAWVAALVPGLAWPLAYPDNLNLDQTLCFSPAPAWLFGRRARCGGLVASFAFVCHGAQRQP